MPAVLEKVKKANFMFHVETLEKLNALIPAGERSRFVDSAVSEAIRDYGRRKAVEMMDRIRASGKVTSTTEEILKAIRYGRL